MRNLYLIKPNTGTKKFNFNINKLFPLILSIRVSGGKVEKFAFGTRKGAEMLILIRGSLWHRKLRLSAREAKNNISSLAGE